MEDLNSEKALSLSTDFKKLMLARFLFTFAVQMQAILLGWQMYLLARDPLYLGLIGLAEALPALGLALYAGYIVDRGRPLSIYRSLILVSLLSGLILFLSQSAEFEISNSSKIASLFVSAFLTGLARAFSQPSIFVIVPRLVLRENLRKASAWMSTAMQIARISGPALGGLVFAWAGVEVGASLVLLMLLAAGAVLSLIQIRLERPNALPTNLSKKQEFLSGAKFVFNHPILFPALSLDMVSVLFGGVTSLLPLFAAQILKVGPTGLGILRAAPAVGAASTSLWLTRFEIRAKAGKLLLAVVAGFGISILVFSLSENYWLSLIALITSGAFDSVSMVIRTAAVQLASPDAMRGKISAVNSIFIGSSNELGEFESGIAAKFLGTVPAAVVGGVICLLTVAVVSLISPSLRKLNLDELTSI